MRITAHGLRRRFIGDRAFYHRTAAILVPMMIQNTVSNVVSLLDNVMVGQVGTLQMSAVAIINQLMFVFNLCIFGGLAGAGIFGAQYAGAGDHDGLRHCFRIKLMLAAAMVVAGTAVFLLGQDPLITMYLAEGTDAADAALTTGFAKDYLYVMLFGLLPFGLSQVYSSTLRETGETRLPMLASVTAILVNLLFNWLLIFGSLGFPQLGVTGAAIATVLSRYVECAIIAVYTHTHGARHPFIRHAYRSLRVPAALWKQVAVKGSPLLLNEFLWSSGMAMLLQCYSVRGLDVVAACNINSTVSNLFNVVFISMGSAVSVLIGQRLGARDIEGAKTDVWRLNALAVVSSAAVGLVMFLLAPVIPHIYNTSDGVIGIACSLLRVGAVMMPLYAYCNNCYFILRSGGKTLITFLFDSVFTWVFSFTTAWCLAHLTGMDVVSMYLCVEALNLLKCVIGTVLVVKGVWIHNLTVGTEET